MAFVDGDLGWFFCPDWQRQLRTEGFQLVRAASVSDADAFQLYCMVSGPIAETLQSGEALMLLGPPEHFLSVSDDGTVEVSAASPDDGKILHVVRVDGGGGLLEVDALVEVRLGSEADAPCLQMRMDGTIGVAPSSMLPGTRLTPATAKVGMAVDAFMRL